MTSAFLHARFDVAQQRRQPHAALRLLLIIPLAEVLPTLLLGRAFLVPGQQEAFFLTNVSWVIVSGMVIQQFVATEHAIVGKRVDRLLAVDGSLIPWILGTALSTSVVYAVSTGIACGVVAVTLGYHVSVALLIVTYVLSATSGLALASAAVALRISAGRVFHIINAFLDVMKILACVTFPLAILSVYVRPLSLIVPMTYVNEFLRGGAPDLLLPALMLSLGSVLVSCVLVNAATTNYQLHGNLTPGR